MTYRYGGQLISRSGIGLSGSYTRNTLGQVTHAVSNAVTYDYTYDTAHRVATMTDSRGPQTISYDYKAGGRLTTRKQWHQGAEVSRTDYVYDAVGRLSAMWAGHGEVLTFVYDAGGRLTEQWLPNGVNAHYSYNEDNTLQHLEHRTIGGTLLAEHEYTYDAVGNRATYIDSDPSCSTVTTATYSYDELNRLIQVITDEDVGSQINTTTESYTYDALGNRLTETKNGMTKAYAYDAANQLTAIHQTDLQGPVLTSFAYDLNGNLTSKSGSSGTLTMTYDAWDRLIQAQKTWALPEYYTYDDEGRRIQRTVGTSTSNYLYDGLDIIAEYTTTNWTTPQVHYTHGPGIDAPIIRASGGTSSYYHQDGLGSVVAMTDESGDATGTVRYDAWGAVARQTGGIPQYGYTGREPDNTGLVYYRARYYDPDTGRFTQPDPVGLSGGTNLYAYAGGDPVNFTDPMGTTPLQAQRLFGSAFVGQKSYTSFDIGVGNNLSFKNVALPANITSDVAQQVVGRAQSGSNFSLQSTFNGGSGSAGVQPGQNPISADAFVDYVGNQSLRAVQHAADPPAVNVNNLSAGGPPPEVRFMTDPGNPRAVIDMRHFLVVGEKGELFGLGVEVLQGLMLNESAFDLQDLHSNALGAEFFRTYNRNKPLGSQLRKFFNKRKK